uniref:Brix domain-containing protein ZK795.3-like n=1 Tax=Nicotiana tabacum TaxID=4097 RepID=A0A1S3YEY4_TOBAC|nr:PREDICTED: brix domain-containing protein ZK795.3-like [Nicotiana tabacum]
MIWLKHFITFMYLHTYLVLFYTLIMCLHFSLFFLFLQVISEIIETCRAHDFTDVILVHEHRGVPDGIIISHLPFGPTAYFGLLNVVTRHDIKDKTSIGTMPEAYPHLIFDKLSTKLGERTVNILKHLFPVPKPDTKRIITFANQSDYISFRLVSCL